jgi:hypothetical protein
MANKIFEYSSKKKITKYCGRNAFGIVLTLCIMRKTLTLYFSAITAIFLFLQPSLVSGAEMPMQPSGPTMPSTPTMSPPAVDTTKKGDVYMTQDRDGNIVLTSEPSKGVKISSLTLKKLEAGRRGYDIGFFSGYTEGFAHYQEGGTYEALIAGGRFNRLVDDPLVFMAKYEGKLAGWQAARLAHEVNSNIK